MPHGISVALTAPEACRFTFAASPVRHLRAAYLLAPETEQPGDPAQMLPSALTERRNEIGIPNGIGGVGYDKDDIDDLVPGTMQQQRVLATAPRPVREEDIAGIPLRSLALW